MVEDSEDDMLLIIRELKKGGYNPVYERAENAAAMKKALQEKQWDIILCDYKMPKFSGEQAIALLKETNIDIPLIIVSGNIGEETAVKCMLSGAQDYIMKGNLSRLCPSIARELKEAEVRAQRKRAEDELRESEEKFSNLVAQAPLSIQILDISGKTIKVNQAFEDLWGVTFEQMGDYNIFEDDQFKDIGIRSYLEKAFSGESVEFPPAEFTPRTKSFIGRKRMAQAIAYPVRDKAGVIRQVTMIHQDVTESKQAEKDLRESEKKYRLLADNVDDVIFVLDMNLNCTYVSPSVKILMGYEPEELLKQPAIGTMTPSSWNLVTKTLSEIIELEKSEQGENSRYQTLQLEMKRKDGTTVWTEMNASYIRDENHQPVSIMGVVHDITERKRSEDELKKSEENFRRSLDDSPLGVRIVSAEGETVYVNRAALDIYGYDSIEEMKRIPVKGRYTPQSYAEYKIRKKKREQGELAPSEYELSIVRKNGAVRHLLAFRKEILWNGVKKAQIIYQDITERKKIEDEFQKLVSVVRHSSELINLSTIDGKMFFLNEAGCVMLGIEPDKVHEFNIQDVISEHLIQKVRTELIPLLMRGCVWEGELQYINLKTGRRTDVSAMAYTITDPVSKKPLYFANVSRDITERKRAESDLLRSEEKYRSLVENSQEGIFQSTAGGNHIAVNQAFANILGYDSQEEVMATVADINYQIYVHPDDRKKILQIIEKEGSVKGYEAEFYKKDGSRIWVSINMHAVRDEEGNLLYYQGINQDITEKKNMETERQQNIERLRKSLEATINAMAVTVETKDPYTAGHQRRVADLARSIAVEMKLKREQIDSIRMASSIHDIGKISLPTEILSKPTKLTELEFSLIKTHARIGFDILKDIEFPWPVADLVLKHHERMDGSGYPQGLKGKNIPLEARILCVADVVESITSHRPYRPALGVDFALEEISGSKGILYDADVVDACLKLFREKGYVLPRIS